jgi:hypothetical protein
MNDTKLDGNASDGFHTFNELYDHRSALFLALMKSNRDMSWFSLKHGDGTELEGWFIAGIRLDTGDVTYHMSNRFLSAARGTGALEMELGCAWDGHTSNDVIHRLLAFSRV